MPPPVITLAGKRAAEHTGIAGNIMMVEHSMVSFPSLFYLIRFTAALLLGLGNLLLAVPGRLPRTGLWLWHALLVVSLLMVVYLMRFQIGLIIWLILEG